MKKIAGNCGEVTAELLKVHDGVVDAEKSLIGLHRKIRDASQWNINQQGELGLVLLKYQ